MREKKKYVLVCDVGPDEVGERGGVAATTRRPGFIIADNTIDLLAVLGTRRPVDLLVTAEFLVDAAEAKLATTNVERTLGGVGVLLAPSAWVALPLVLAAVDALLGIAIVGAVAKDAVLRTATSRARPVGVALGDGITGVLVSEAAKVLAPTAIPKLGAAARGAGLRRTAFSGSRDGITGDESQNRKSRIPSRSCRTLNNSHSHREYRHCIGLKNTRQPDRGGQGR